MIFVCEILFGTPYYDEAVSLRNDILRRPLGVAFTVEALAEEYRSYHLCALDSLGHMLACLMLTPIDANTVQMRQVAVAKDRQRQRLGQQLVYASEDFAIQKGYSYMILHARDTAVPFYEKLNYRTEGVPFEEVGVQHRHMRKNLT